MSSYKFGWCPLILRNSLLEMSDATKYMQSSVLERCDWSHVLDVLERCDLSHVLDVYLGKFRKVNAQQSNFKE